MWSYGPASGQNAAASMRAVLSSNSWPIRLVVVEVAFQNGHKVPIDFWYIHSGGGTPNHLPLRTGLLDLLIVRLELQRDLSHIFRTKVFA